MILLSVNYSAHIVECMIVDYLPLLAILLLASRERNSSWVGLHCQTVYWKICKALFVALPNGLVPERMNFIKRVRKYLRRSHRQSACPTRSQSLANFTDSAFLVFLRITCFCVLFEVCTFINLHVSLHYCTRIKMWSTFLHHTH